MSDAVVRRTGVEPVWIVRLSDCRRRSSPGALNGFIRRLRSSPWPIIVPPRVCWHSRLCGVAALTPWGDDACLRMDSNHVLRLFRPMLCRLSYKGVAGIPSSDPPAGAVRTASVLADGRRLDDGGGGRMDWISPSAPRISKLVEAPSGRAARSVANHPAGPRALYRLASNAIAESLPWDGLLIGRTVSCLIPGTIREPTT